MLLIKLEGAKFVHLSRLINRHWFDEARRNSFDGGVFDDSLLDHEVEHLLHTLVYGVTTCLNFEVWTHRHLIGVTDSSEVLNQTVSRFLVKSFGITLLADAQWSGHMTFVERQIETLVDLLSIIPILAVRRNESHNADLARHSK